MEELTQKWDNTLLNLDTQSRNACFVSYYFYALIITERKIRRITLIKIIYIRHTYVRVLEAGQLSLLWLIQDL